MSENFMVSDIVATSVALVVFSLFVFVPGYVSSWGLDLLGFRRRSTLTRAVISTPVSIAIFPVLTYLAWHWSMNAVWALFGGCWLVFGVIVIAQWKRPVLSRRALILCAIVAAWIVVGIGCLIDLQIGHRLYFPTVSYDYMLRTAVTSSITRSGVPPDNPYFFPGRSFPLRYHYFWLIPCSLVDRFGGSLVGARQAVIAGTAWCGIGLMSIVSLYLRFFQPKGAANIEKRTLIGIALLAVTGLDLVPTVILSVLRGGVIESVEWWNGPVMGWVHAVLWVPHHVAGLIACLTGFLVIYDAFQRTQSTKSRNAMAAVAGGVMFATAVGSSIYVAFVFAAGLGVLVVLLLLKKYRSEAAMLALAGIVAVAASLPYLMDLSGRSERGSNAAAVEATRGSPVFELAVRPFTLAEQFVRAVWPDRSWLVPATDVALLPLNYFLELGFYSLVGVVMLQRLRRKEHLDLAELSTLVMVATSLLVCSFLRSSVISNNDLGWRGILVAQFFLLIWAADLWDEGFFTAHARKGLIATLLFLGVAATAYEVSMVRFYTLISDDFAIPRDDWFPADHHIGERTYALRGLYEELRRTLPATAVLQHNPNTRLGDVFHGLYSDRQVAVETPVCGVVFGGDARVCEAVLPSISHIFERRADIGWPAVQAACRDASIDVVVVKDIDTIWMDQQSWVWKREPVAASPYARAFICGAESR